VAPARAARSPAAGFLWAPAVSRGSTKEDLCDGLFRSIAARIPESGGVSRTFCTQWRYQSAPGGGLFLGFLGGLPAAASKHGGILEEGMKRKIVYDHGKRMSRFRCGAVVLSSHLCFRVGFSG